MIAVQERVRSPVVGGMFYPDEKAEALACLRAFGLRRGTGGRARAIIAPHGAWEISGSLAAAAFASAAGRSGPSRIVVMGPIHGQHEQGIFLSNSHFFQTPLGNIPVEQGMAEEFEAYSPLFEIDDIPHLQEHSIEVLLPFIKYCFPDASIVPILMGCPGAESISVLADALRTVLYPVMDDTLLVVSCNLAMDSSGGRALDMARECMRLLSEKRGAEFSEALLGGRLVCCGGALAASLLLSGLVDPMRALPSAPALLSAKGEENKTVYYGAVSFG
ncbi:MAG: AmmeMemoRadiSam system protein B [Treponema sp.]|nr:AmmeMemoRadiSam system protein B [Treponema sp.]